MTHPQTGIFALGTPAHLHLQFDALNNPAALLHGARAVMQTVNTVAGVNVVVGVGPSVARAASDGTLPQEFSPAGAISGVDDFSIPDTQHDLWVWLHGAGHDAVLSAAHRVVSALEDSASLVDEQPSFVYGASQDLTGFEDGTENPPVSEALKSVVIADGNPGAGGSVVLIQRWVHDLESFALLPVTEQEQIMGRTLAGSVELDEDEMPEDSHVSRMVIEDEHGDELEVFRRSTAFGNLAEQGLMFVAFSQDSARLKRMLDRMVGAEDGIRDRLTNFSTPVASAWYFAPPADALAP